MSGVKLYLANLCHIKLYQYGRKTSCEHTWSSHVTLWLRCCHTLPCGLNGEESAENLTGWIFFSFVTGPIMIPIYTGSCPAWYRALHPHTVLWRCHIAPAKPNGPIPFDLNDKRWNFTGQNWFFFPFVTGPIPIYTGSIPGPYTAWYRTLCPHIVLACRSHRVLTVCIPPPLKYAMLLWNINICCSEIYIAALKYVLPLWNIIAAPKYILPLRNMLSRRHAQNTFANHQYTVIYGHRPTNRVHNGLVPPPRPLTVLMPGSHRVPPLVSTRRKVFEYVQNFRRVSPGLAGSRRPLTGHWRVHRSLNTPPCALTVFHRLHEIYHTVAHGRFSRCHVTATLACRSHRVFAVSSPCTYHLLWNM